MKGYEKTKEEGLDFLQLMKLPFSRYDYFHHKNAIDLLIRGFKEKYSDEVDQWRFEMLNIFPGAHMLSSSSMFLTNEILMQLLFITSGEQDAVLPIFGKGVFNFRLDLLEEKIESYLLRTLGNEERRPVLEKLCASSLDEKTKLLIGIVISPEVFLVQYDEFLQNGRLSIPRIETCDSLIDYAIRYSDDKDLVQKISSMANAVLSGLTGDKFSDIESFIQESIDESGSYDEVLAMKKINQYFENKKDGLGPKQKMKQEKENSHN